MRYSTNLRELPVAFFCFNRPDSTRIVWEEIRRHRPARLLLVTDGKREHVPTDAARTAAVREILATVDWECDVSWNCSDQNLGCKRRMSSGLDWVFSQVEKAIILEDDCVPSADFFPYCAEMLARYAQDERVMHISGSNLQDGIVRGDGSYYFSRVFHIWGWATWRRAWKRYDMAMKTWPASRRQGLLGIVFQEQSVQEYWDGIFRMVYLGRFDTWDYQWVYACLRHDGLGITPNANLIQNIGAGPDATHTKGTASLAKPFGALPRIEHPSRVAVDTAADQYTFKHHFLVTRNPKAGPAHWLKRKLIELRWSAQLLTSTAAK